MKIADLSREAFRSLEANRGRSLLTILGIVIGIAAVIAMTSLIGGVRNTLISGMGLNAARSINITCGVPLTDDDLEDLARLIPNYEAIEGTYRHYSPIIQDDYSAGAGITGASSKFLEMTGVASKLAEGRLYTYAEDKASSRLAIIGRNAIEMFFKSPNADAIGKNIKLNNKTYTVIGVLDDGMTGNDYCNVFVPKEAARQDFAQDWEYLSEIVGLIRESADIELVQAQTIEQLGRLKNIAEEDRENMISAWSMKSAIDQLDTFMMSFQLILGSVAGISLLVGGIGIMNMMLTNVTERIREIGVRRALGARGRDITMQFLAESAALCITGGILGTLAGYAIAWGLVFGAGALGFDFASMTGMGTMTLTPAIEPRAIALAVGISVLIGLVFGYYPARRAAKLDPVECLRYQ